ncbi:hypothetical protein E2C01_039606 [Portunus trituberculatus]|uniref:Uncharacterized protein n=1 Tax=Portunus trituberculatus TaxID=210409 RepID=A0A5B7FE27_PORTR|nr:hypothetical protein [Portunus trituberculatus]
MQPLVLRTPSEEEKADQGVPSCLTFTAASAAAAANEECINNSIQELTYILCSLAFLAASFLLSFPLRACVLRFSFISSKHQLPIFSPVPSLYKRDIPPYAL